MIFRQFLEILYKTGLKPIPAVGEMFDPNLHEALLREPSEQPENTILEEIKRIPFRGENDPPEPGQGGGGSGISRRE